MASHPVIGLLYNNISHDAIYLRGRGADRVWSMFALNGAKSVQAGRGHMSGGGLMLLAISVLLARDGGGACYIIQELDIQTKMQSTE